jgi:hypothetical protein
MTIRLLWALVGLLLLPTLAFAQTQRNPCYYTTANPGPGNGCIPVSSANPLPVAATATIGGGFTDAATGTPISVTTGGVTGTLPAGSVVVATNVGATNGAYCKLGASATTSDQYLSPNGGWFAFTAGANTQLTCITSSSTTTVNMTGGSGLPTGTGGGGGGSGSSGAVFGPTANGSPAANPPVLLGGTANGTATGNVGNLKVDSAGTAYIDAVASGALLNSLNSGVGTPGSASPASDIAIGGNAVNAEPTATTNGNNARAITDLVGKLIVLPYANPENFGVGQVTSAMTATTSTALTGMGAPGAALRWYVTACTVSNSHATVGTMINLQDGSGGATIWQFPAAPAYGGATTTFPTAIRQPTLNNGIFAVNATTGSNTFVSCTGYKGA